MAKQNILPICKSGSEFLKQLTMAFSYIIFLYFNLRKAFPLYPKR